MSTAAAPTLNTYRAGPDEYGRFGMFGGRFVAETLMPLILDLQQAYETARGGGSGVTLKSRFRSYS